MVLKSNESSDFSGTHTSQGKMELILEPGPHDVLCGRGGGSQNHIGNKEYRSVIAANKLKYISSERREKTLLVESIVKAVRMQDPPGQFLEKHLDTGCWSDIGDKRAFAKTCQAIREGAPKIRQLLHERIRQEKRKTQKHMISIETRKQLERERVINNPVVSVANHILSGQTHGSNDAYHSVKTFDLSSDMLQSTDTEQKQGVGSKSEILTSFGDAKFYSISLDVVNGGIHDFSSNNIHQNQQELGVDPMPLSSMHGEDRHFMNMIEDELPDGEVADFLAIL